MRSGDCDVVGRTAVSLGAVAAGRLAAPQVLGDRVYLPDQSTGSLVVYDSGAGRIVAQIAVSGRAGPLDVFVSDGMLRANDAAGPDAVAVDDQGGVHHIGKYQPDIPSAPPAPTSAPPAVLAAASATALIGGGPAGAGTGGGSAGGGGTGGGPGSGAAGLPGVVYHGISGWISDLYVSTPESTAGQHDTYSDPALRQCQ